MWSTCSTQWRPVLNILGGGQTNTTPLSHGIPPAGVGQECSDRPPHPHAGHRQECGCRPLHPHPPWEIGRKAAIRGLTLEGRGKEESGRFFFSRLNRKCVLRPDWPGSPKTDTGRRIRKTITNIDSLMLSHTTGWAQSAVLCIPSPPFFEAN